MLTVRARIWSHWCYWLQCIVILQRNHISHKKSSSYKCCVYIYNSYRCYKVPVNATIQWEPTEEVEQQKNTRWLIHHSRQLSEFFCPGFIDRHRQIETMSHFFQASALALGAHLVCSQHSVLWVWTWPSTRTCHVGFACTQICTSLNTQMQLPVQTRPWWFKALFFFVAYLKPTLKQFKLDIF